MYASRTGRTRHPCRIREGAYFPAAALAVAISGLLGRSRAAARDGADFAGEQAGLFPRREVPAAGGLFPVDDVGKAALGAAVGGTGYRIWGTSPDRTARGGGGLGGEWII